MAQIKCAPRRQVDGVMLLDKPASLASNAALQSAKRLLNAAKAGHTGTLDPAATGLLPLCFGESTKFARFLLDADKTYDAVVELGVTTTTADSEGAVLSRNAVEISRAQVEAELGRLRGEIMQVPPMFSALKRGGRPLYELARAGIEVERSPRRVTIYSAELIRFEGTRIELRLRCSKGTYIRSFASDLGSALGCGAYLAALRRLRIGALDVEGAVSLEALARLDPESRDTLLLGSDILVAQLPRVVLGEDDAERLQCGQHVNDVAGTGMCRVYSGERFVGVAHCDAQGRLAPQRLMRARSKVEIE